MGEAATFTAAAVNIEVVLRLERDLGVSFAVAQVLARRGYTDTESARSFLAADEQHPASAFAGIDAATGTVLTAMQSGRTITVHGDYDVDGVTSTAILVRTLRSLGADVDWFLPSRTEDGYGLSQHTVRALAERGTGLIILSDCGITAVSEVALARELGMEVVVVDHHTPRADGLLPDAPIVHPVVCGYPFTELCAAGVAHKFAGALLEATGHDASILVTDLDLVALGTIADCVALRGENRRLVRAGLRQLERTEKPGLRALMRVAQINPQKVSARDVSFRLAPRLNAAGRVARADAALELLLTHDPARAEQIAAELDDVNSRRRFEELRVLHETEAQVAAQGDQPAYVVAGEGWHPGVVGIVASRIAESRHRPALVISLRDGVGTGSGRSIPGVDLLAGLQASAEVLDRFGGHRAAAGCTFAAGRLPQLREAFVGHFERTLTADDLIVRERVDAVVGGDALGHELAEELERLAPFGFGNPSVSLQVAGARLTDPRPIGEGKHTRFTLVAGGRRAQGVAFGVTSIPAAAQAAALPATFTLELNEYRGAVEPRLVLRHLGAEPPAGPELIGEPEPGTAAWAEAVRRAAVSARRPILAAVGAGSDASATGGAADAQPAAGRDRPALPPDAVDRRGSAPAGIIGALVESGEPVLVIAADAILRLDQCRGRIGGFGLCSWDALAGDPDLAAGSVHLVALDPPLDEDHDRLLAGLAGTHVVHLAWGEAELRCSRDALDRDLSPRQVLAGAYRALRDGLDLGAAFGRIPASAAGRMLAILLEIGVVEITENGKVVVPGGVAQTDLRQSSTFRDGERRAQERAAWLSRLASSAAGQAA